MTESVINISRLMSHVDDASRRSTEFVAQLATFGWGCLLLQ